MGYHPESEGGMGPAPFSETPTEVGELDMGNISR